MQTELSDSIGDLGYQVRHVERVEANAADERQSRREKLQRALRLYRANAGETLRSLGDRIGVTAAHLHDIEHGRRYSQRVVDWLLEHAK